MKKIVIFIALLSLFVFSSCKTNADDNKSGNKKTMKATLYLCEDLENPMGLNYWYADGKYRQIYLVNEELQWAKLSDGTYVNALGYLENAYFVPGEETDCPVYSCVESNRTYYALSPDVDNGNHTYNLVEGLKCTKLEYHSYDWGEEDDGKPYDDGLLFELNGATCILYDGEFVQTNETLPTRKVNVTITFDENCPQIDSDDTETTIGYTWFEGKKYYVANMFAE